MEWENLLSNQRLSHSHQRQPGRSPFNQDYGRVLYSSAFRCLQDKTQVFPLGRNDYVRTRLTHSLEVANVGRTLAQHLVTQIREYHHTSPSLPLEAIEDIVATACLAHDIGNPPFGHSGEKAIEIALAETSFSDFCFEGNAQGFHLLTRTCDPIRSKGLDLTAATLGSFTKYPCIPDGVQKEGPISCKKFGLNRDSLDDFRMVATICGLPEQGKNIWTRHPLAFLMEAADDISYLIADLEDAYISGIISYTQARDQLCSLASLDPARLEDERSRHGEASAIRLARAVAVGYCIQCIANTIQNQYQSMMQGNLDKSLLQVSEIAEAYKAVQEFSTVHIYNHEMVVKVEITGFNVIRGLMELMLQWVNQPDSALGRKLGAILHATPEKTDSKEQRFQHIIDYISGMTDSFALQTYRSLYGYAPVS